jgi:YihY family inner membrane protein
MSDRVDTFYQHLVGSPTTPVLARRALKVGALFVREITRDQLHVRAATLAYWSLVAIVPTLVLAAAVLQPLGGEASRPIRQFIFSALLAGSVQTVGATLDGWLAQVDVAGLGVAGVLGVALTASRIYFSVEEAYNRLWNVRMRRSLIMRVVLFYAFLTLAPLLIAVGFHVTGKIQDAATAGSVRHLLPVLLTATAFVGAIRALPDTDVAWRPALIGGLTSAVLFEAAKVGFNAYVGVLGAETATTAIYGSLGLFPFFLIWLYVLWLIVLLGVELAYVVQRHDDLLEAEERYLLGESTGRRHPDALFAVQCLLVVARNYALGMGPTTEPKVTHELRSEPAFVLNVLETLEAAGLLAESPLGYLPALPLDRVTVRDVIRHYRRMTLPAVAPDAAGAELVDAILGSPGGQLDHTLQALLGESGAA